MSERKINKAIELLKENNFIVVPRPEDHYDEFKYKEIFDTPLKDFLQPHLPKATATRIYNSLNYETDPDTRYVGQLVARPDFMVQAYPNLGKKSFEDLKRVLYKHVLTFSMNTQGWMPPTPRPAKEKSNVQDYVAPESYRRGFIERYQPGARFPIGATASRLLNQIENWPIMNDLDVHAMVVMKNEHGHFQTVHAISLGEDRRYYSRGLAVAEFRYLMQEWKDKNGEVRAGLGRNEFRIKGLTSVKPLVMEGGWEANELALLT